MEKANSTITQLKGELHASSSREADLKQALDDKDEKMEQQLEGVRQSLSDSATAERQIAADMQDLLQKEQSCSAELRAALARELAKNQNLSQEGMDTKSQLHEAEAKLVEMEASRLVLDQALTEAQKQQAAANEEATTANLALEKNLEEAKRLKAYLQSQETATAGERRSLEQQLANEQQAASSLRDILHGKEVELTRAVDQYLQEKVALAKARGEIAALETRLRSLQEEDASLREQLVSSGGETQRTLAGLLSEKAELQASLQRDEAQVKELQGQLVS